ncbi:MAG TPA: DUF11 domain-containing protein [Gaiellaceae bacterium]|nr:DUF11 domain-containing protein [Gaiellaceae bacterium]
MRSYGRFVFVLVLALAATVALTSAQRNSARAATPSSGTLGPTGPSVTWDGFIAAAAASASEGTCVEGVTCDTFVLNVSGLATDWTGKVVDVRISWVNPANDFDLFIHKGSNSGPIVADSAGGAPDTDEEATFSPAADGTGAYSVHVVYFSVAADQYHGTASAKAAPTARTATYVDGGIAFSPNVTTKAPVAARDGEPSNRTDVFGNFYVVGIRGVPAGVDLWSTDLNSDPYVRNWVYRGQPDSFTADQQTSVGADGGGDVDIAVGRPDPVTGTSNNPPTLAGSSLVLANVSCFRSTNKGVTFDRNPLCSSTGGVPIDDRQWNEFQGKNTVYLLYRTVAPALTQIQRSTDGGLTYGAAQTAGFIGQVGYIDVNQNDGTVYVSGSTGQVCHSTLTLLDGTPSGYECHQAASGSVNNIFFPVKVAEDGTPNGTVYVAYSDTHDIFLAHSFDKGVTWSQPVKVSHGPDSASSLMPWLETGPTPGSVGVVWYGSSSGTNNDSANWKVFYAQSYDATSANPTFRQVTASDHFIHGSNISTGGTLGTANRNLLDYFQISFDPTGGAVVGYTDDHNDFDGHTYVTHQIGGPGLNKNKTSVPSPGPAPAPQSGPFPLAADVGGEPGSQVTDFQHDVADALLVVTPTDDPLDILSIKYSCEGIGASTQLVASMKVSGSLGGLDSGLNWRMNFAANAPNSVLSPTGDYSFGLSDRGDQFFLRASTDPTQPSQFSFGTAVRNSDGTITHTRRGAATGSFNNATKTIVVKVPLSGLNPFVTHGPALDTGSVLVGLRGQTFTSNVNAKRDLTRGGTQSTIGCGPTADLSVDKTDSPDPVSTRQSLTYTIKVLNGGPSAAAGVTLSDDLPNNTSFGTASSTQGSCALTQPQKRIVTCNLGTIASGGTVTVTIAVTPPSKKTTIQNTASVTATTSDPNIANNTDTESTTVIP